MRTFLARATARFTYANVVATLALLFAMSGGAYALTVTSGQIQNGTITSTDIKNNSITDADVQPLHLGWFSISTKYSIYNNPTPITVTALGGEDSPHIAAGGVTRISQGQYCISGLVLASVERDIRKVVATLRGAATDRTVAVDHDTDCGGSRSVRVTVYDASVGGFVDAEFDAFIWWV
jgi:hypothetical protein